MIIKMRINGKEIGMHNKLPNFTEVLFLSKDSQNRCMSEAMKDFEDVPDMWTVCLSKFEPSPEKQRQLELDDLETN